VKRNAIAKLVELLPNFIEKIYPCDDLCVCSNLRLFSLCQDTCDVGRLFTNDFNYSIANNYNWESRHFKTVKNPEQWTSNMVRNINDLDVWTVCNFILASCEAYLILIWISQKNAVVAALQETKKYIYIFRFSVT